ncbi:MAG: SCO family protein [Candidatus Omnitrophica bacterium]|nr:SCO family protein [Candidatus Omnitrophota bacterium]
MAASRKNLVMAGVALSVALAVICGVYIFQSSLQRPRLPVLGQVKPFTFTDAQNKKLAAQDLYRNVWIAGAFSTPCVNGCNAMMKNMASLSRTFEQVTAVKLVAVTLSPVRDTPQVLSEFSGRYVQGKGNWFFVGGRREEVDEFVQRQLRLDLDATGAFSPTLALVDRSGYIRGYYDGTVTAEVNQLFLDASALLKERF